jgi:hypothetical protein
VVTQQSFKVVRPSGIWNSRAPLNNYLIGVRKIERAKSLQALGIYKLRRPLSLMKCNETIRRIFVGKNPNLIAESKYWENYKRSYPFKGDSEELIVPNCKDALSDSYFSLQAALEGAIVRLSSHFELFVQCWCLNMILSHIENGDLLDDKQHDLVSEFSPLNKRKIPNIISIVKAFPEIKKGLLSTPRMFRDPKTGSLVLKSDHPSDSALAAIMFWRRYRNLCIHQGGRISSLFYEKNGNFFDTIAETLDHIKMEPGKTLPFHDDLYGAMGAAHYKAAIYLNEALECQSNGRRGHPESPNAKTIEKWSREPKSPPLLIEGDHEASLEWTKKFIVSQQSAHDQQQDSEKRATLWQDYIIF